MNNRKKSPGKIISNTEISPGIFELLVESEASDTALPGQFVMVYPKNESMLLPRPISICQALKEKGELRLVYRVAGKGTKEFSGYSALDYVDILGPIGNGFPVDMAEGKKALLLGGGIGIPPLLYLAENLSKLPGTKVYSVLGYRDSNLFLTEEFSEASRLYIATEDGSFGFKGNVLEAVKEYGIKPDIIYACGPMPMLRAIKAYAGENEIPAYISLEERMACGVGACLGCVCNTVNKDHHSHVNNARVCTEGPVFDGREVNI